MVDSFFWRDPDEIEEKNAEEAGKWEDAAGQTNYQEGAGAEKQWTDDWEAAGEAGENWGAAGNAGAEGW